MLIAELTLNGAKTDKSDVLLYEDSFSESTIYGVVKRGIVHTHKFSYSGKSLKRVERNGVIDYPWQIEYGFGDLGLFFFTEKPARWS
jgi:hypothetical protein